VTRATSAHRRPVAARRARGFSLIEVLLSLVLLAVGLGLAFATLRNATIATERAETAAQRQERLRAVQAFLRRQLDAAMTQPMEYDEETGEATVFVAEDGGIAFVAPMPGYLSRGGPYVQRFRLARGVGGGLQLEFEHRLLTPDGAIDPEREPEVLLTGIAEGRFELRTLDDEGKPGDWTTDWETPALLPRLVRLELRMQDEAVHWPTLVAAPKLGATVQPVLAMDADPVPAGVEQ
jgi:general secretion pathway protein J